MTTVYHNKDIDSSVLNAKRIAIIGYGNQGRPQALNLRDSGLNVLIGAREDSKNALRAQTDGLVVLPIQDAVQQADVVMMLLPDETMQSVYQAYIAPVAKSGMYLGFAHGMAIHAQWVKPSSEINVFLLAPKAQGRGVRNRYVEGSGVPGLVAVHQDPSGNTLQVALAYGQAIGCARMGILKTTFAQETISDLFSEQAVLCGGLTQLIKTAFEVLVSHGIDPEIAYFECLYEVKLIADLLQTEGITGMRQRISSTALFGDLLQGERVIDSHVRESMERVYHSIANGHFAESFLKEVSQGRPFIHSRMAQDEMHAIEETGRKMRDSGLLP